MTKLINRKELQRQYQLEPRKTILHLSESIQNGTLKPDNFSVRDTFIALVEGGEEALSMIDHRRKGGTWNILEAANAVNTADFSSITGQFIFAKIKEGFQDPAFLWPDLVETIPTTILDGERIPGIGGIGDKAEVIDEGMPYPTVGLNEEYLQTAATKKRGFIVPVTREIIVADRTGLLLKNAERTGYWLGLNKEKRVLDVVLGVTNNYNRNGTSYNTYATSGPYINSQSGNALDTSGYEWRAFEKSELLFDAMTDPNTGELITVKPNAVIVPTALRMTAMRILNATEVQTVDNQVAAGTQRSTSPNPLRGSNIKILSSSQVKARSSSASTWFHGDFKKGFAYMEVWGIEPTQAASNSEAEFTQDIMQRYKVTERGAAQVMEPRCAVKNAA